MLWAQFTMWQSIFIVFVKGQLNQQEMCLTHINITYKNQTLHINKILHNNLALYCFDYTIITTTISVLQQFSRWILVRWFPLAFLPPAVLEQNLWGEVTEVSMDRISFLSPNQQCQSTEENSKHWPQMQKITHWSYLFLTYHRPTEVLLLWHRDSNTSILNDIVLHLCARHTTATWQLSSQQLSAQQLKKAINIV